MIKSYQYCFYPDKEQKKLINRTLECCDFMVDYCLKELEMKEGSYDEIDMMLEFAFYKMRTGNYSDICDEPINDRMKNYINYIKK